MTRIFSIVVHLHYLRFRCYYSFVVHKLFELDESIRSLVIFAAITSMHACCLTVRCITAVKCIHKLYSYVQLFIYLSKWIFDNLCLSWLQAWNTFSKKTEFFLFLKILLKIISLQWVWKLLVTCCNELYIVKSKGHGNIIPIVCSVTVPVDLLPVYIN